MIARMGLSRGLAKLRGDWFVDSVNGSDTNTGKSAAQAFQSINRLVNYNYVHASEDFSQVPTGDLTPVSSVIAPPANAGAVWYLRENTNNASHWACPGSDLVSGEATISVYAKGATRTKLRIVMPWNTGYAFDLSAGTGSSIGNDPDGWGIVAVGNGWYRLWITLGLGSSPGMVRPYFRVLNATGNDTYQGDGASGLYLTGMQVNTVGPAVAHDQARPYAYVATTANAGAQSLVAHQKVGLACGSKWREGFTGQPDYITAQAYGSGAKPMLDCSDAIASYLWQKSAGSTNVYQCGGLPIDWSSGETFVSVWQDGVRLAYASSIANCDATPGSYYPSDTQSSPITIYVHTLTGDTPSNHLMEYSRRQYGFVDGGKNCVTTGIWARRNLHHAGSLVINGTAINCLASEGNWHNLYVGAGAVLSGVECLDAYWPMGGSGCLAVYNANTANGENITFQNCWFHCSTPNPNMDGVYGHVNTSGAFGTISFLNCRVDNCSNGITAGDTASVVVNGGSSTGCRIALAPNGRAFTVTGFTATSSLYGLQTQNQTVSATVTACSFSLTGGWGTAGVSPGSNNSSIDLEQTSISGSGAFGVYNSSTGLRFKARQNNITCDGYYWYLPVAPATLDSDNNTFGAVSASDTGAKKMNVGGTDYTLAAYKTATGQDGHSNP
jgi:hypothetical protein